VTTRRLQMGRLINRVALVAAGSIALAGGAIAAAPAGAASGGGVHARVVHASHGFPPAYPTSKIKGQGSTAKFKPNALTVAEDLSGGNCAETGAPVSFALKNTGTAAAYVTFNGGPLGKLPAGQTGTVCLYGGAEGDQATVGLTNKKGTVTYAATLTLTASD
jgi:hypothetical protein